MTQDSYYVYVLLDPRKPGEYQYGKWTFTHRPFYVGKGKGGRARRHFKDYLNKSTTQSYNARKVKRIAAIHEATGGEPIVKAIKNLSEARAFELEQQVIDAIGYGRNGPLVNMTAGGLGGTGAIRKAMSTKSKAALSTSIKRTLQNKDDAYWKQRAANVSKTWKAKRAADPESYAKSVATNSEQRKAHYQSDAGKKEREWRSEHQRRIMAERYAAMNPVDIAKTNLKKRLGHLLKRLEEKARAKVKEALYAFIDGSRHRCPERFMRDADVMLHSFKLV